MDIETKRANYTMIPIFKTKLNQFTLYTNQLRYIIMMRKNCKVIACHGVHLYDAYLITVSLCAT